MGAGRLHIVDLDGAANGGVSNLGVIREIASALLIPTQLGGGIRNLETIEQWLKAGIERVILGTAAVEDTEMVREACRNFSERVIVGVDAREGYVATHGWQQQTDQKAVEFARFMVKRGVRRFVYTDISRDGTLTEPNFTAVAEMVDSVRAYIIAAGGVSSIGQLEILAKLGVEGAIVGRALYTGDINLKRAIDTISRV